MIEKVDGIVISSIDFKESSKILKIFTKKYGIISVISKGCKKIKSNLRVVSEDITYISFTMYYKKDKISTLTEGNILNYYKNIKEDIIKISYVRYILDLSEQVYQQNSNKEIFDLVIGALNLIERNLDPKVIANIIELKLLNYLGVGINIDGCVKCGNKNVFTVSPYKGGYICKNCLENEKIVSQKTMKMIKLFYYVDIANISKLNISEETQKEINEFLDEYYKFLTGIFVKSKAFLNDLNKIK